MGWKFETLNLKVWFMWESNTLNEATWFYSVVHEYSRFVSVHNKINS